MALSIRRHTSEVTMSLFTNSQRDYLLHVIRNTDQARTIAPISTALREIFPEVVFITALIDNKPTRLLISAFDASVADVEVDTITIDFLEQHLPSMLSTNTPNGANLNAMLDSQNAEFYAGINTLRTLYYFDENIHYGNFYERIARLAFCNHNLTRFLDNTPEGTATFTGALQPHQIADMSNKESMLTAYDLVAEKLNIAIYGNKKDRYPTTDLTYFMIFNHMNTLSVLANRVIELDETGV